MGHHKKTIIIESDSSSSSDSLRAPQTPHTYVSPQPSPSVAHNPNSFVNTINIPQTSKVECTSCQSFISWLGVIFK